MAPLDAVALTAVSGVAVPLFQSLIDSGGKILGLFGRQIDRATKQTIYTASGEYASRFAQRHGQIKLLGMRQPLDLGAVAVPLLVSIDDEARRFASAEECDRAFAETGHFAPPGGTVLPALELARQRRCVMVLGTPGSGKTTILRQVGLKALRGKTGAKSDGEFLWLESDKSDKPDGSREKAESSGGSGGSGSSVNSTSEAIPVFVELKRFANRPADRPLDLREELVKEFEVCGFPEADGFVDIALDRGKLLILLDGLDELPADRRNDAIGQIQDFVDRHNKNRFLCSCRSPVYQHNLKQFVDAVVLNLSPSQVQEFVARWAIAHPIEARPDIGETVPNEASPTESDRGEPSADRADKANREPNQTDDAGEPGATEEPEEPDADRDETFEETSTEAPPDTSRILARDPELAELSRSPLLLTLLSSIEPASLSRPSNRSYLYQEIVELYLSKWSEFQRVTRSALYPDFGAALQQRFFGEIALEASKARRVFFARRDLVAALTAFLKTEIQAPDRLDSSAILDEIVAQQGILTQRSRDVFSFDRVTLQAYCAAVALGDRASGDRPSGVAMGDRAMSDREIETLAGEYLGDPLWRSIFPLWLSRLGYRGAVLLSALEKTARKRQTPLLEAWPSEPEAIATLDSESLQSWQVAIAPFSIAAIAAELSQIAPPPDSSRPTTPGRLRKSLDRLWNLLNTDLLAGGAEPTSDLDRWQMLANHLVVVETLARCRAAMQP